MKQAVQLVVIDTDECCILNLFIWNKHWGRFSSAAFFEIISVNSRVVVWSSLLIIFYYYTSTTE